MKWITEVIEENERKRHKEAIKNFNANNVLKSATKIVSIQEGMLIAHGGITLDIDCEIVQTKTLT